MLQRPARPDVGYGAPCPRRPTGFLLGLLAGGLIGPAMLWAALPHGEVEQSSAYQDLLAQKVVSDTHAQEAAAERKNADVALADTMLALDAARRDAKAVAKQRQDAERRLREAQADLKRERKELAALEKALAEAKKPRPAATHSFVRDWLLLGPFPSQGERAHDTAYPPEREPVQLHKAYDGYGGQVRWRAYNSPQDKIDLAAFFKYTQPGAAYAVSWVYSEADQAVSLGVGSDDGIRLWVNGLQVHDIKGGRQARPGQDMVKARLRKGWNEIRAKVDTIFGSWEMYLEFRTADNRQPLRIASTRTPPPEAAR